MASRAAGKVADGVLLSRPVTYFTISLRPLIKGSPSARRIFARHLPGSRSKARTTKCFYSMAENPSKCSTAQQYWRYSQE
jgi:hypothetical protein